MPRRKPASSKQKKAELQIKRAVKRGDISADAAKGAKISSGRGRGGRTARGRLTAVTSKEQAAARRLESSFVKISPDFVEETRRKASTLALPRPIPPEGAVFSVEAVTLDSLTVLKRPKWKFDMTKKEVESNEAGVFRKWLEETDKKLQTWKGRNLSASPPEQDVIPPDVQPTVDSESLGDGAPSNEMPFCLPLYERNLEVWRQLWRVTEICQVLLILLDSRCPLLHYPPSLHDYLSTLRPARQVIFVLTKVDITGPDCAARWSAYISARYPGTRLVQVESYVEKRIGAGQGKRKFFEPHIPTQARQQLVHALKEAHAELCTPPPSVKADAERLATWVPNVKTTINWDAVLHAGEGDIVHRTTSDAPLDRDDLAQHESTVSEYISVGLLGQPNVGKSSLLNALFGTHKVKASRTPGKTKHFQTLFWTEQIRLVDCPGLVFPAYVDMELQVLSGILPISQVPAIPSSTYYALRHLPLEKIYKLQHPAETTSVVEDKRTWRGGTRPVKAEKPTEWTAMDVLTALAERKGWITAKAGRPDVNRAGNAALRALAEGKIKWAFYPPKTDLEGLPKRDEGMGVWIKDAEDADDEIEFFESDNEHSDMEESENGSSSEDSEDTIEAQREVEALEDPIRVRVSEGTGMFSALSMKDDHSAEEDDEENDDE